MFTKFAFYLLLNYTNMLNCRSILIATSKSGNEAMNTSCFEIFALLFSRSGFGRPFFSRVRFCSASGSYIYILIIWHSIVVIWKRYKIYFLNRVLKSDCVDRSALVVLQQTLYIWTLAK